MAVHSLLNGKWNTSYEKKSLREGEPGNTSQTILENCENLLLNKPYCLIIHAGISDLTNGKNMLNPVKKIKAVEKALQKQK